MNQTKRAWLWFVREIKLWGCLLLGLGGAVAIAVMFRRSPLLALSLVVMLEIGVIWLGIRISKDHQQAIGSQDGSRDG